MFVFCALLAALAVYAYADRALLGMLGAREYALAEDPLLRSTVDALAAKLAVRPAEALSDPGRLSARIRRRPRAARDRRSPLDGPARRAAPAELEAVLAHELAHVRPRDVLVQTSAVMLAVVLVDLSRDRRVVRAGAARGARPDRSRVRASAPLAATRAGRRPDGRGSTSARATRSLTRCCGSTRASDLVSFQASPATEPLYTVNPFAEEGLAALFVTHPRSHRLEALRGLAG